MKKTLFTLVAAAMAVLSSSAANDGNVTFSGQLKGLKDTLIVFSPAGQGVHRDTVLTKDGKFNFTVNVSKPVNIYAYTPGTVRHEEQIGFKAIAVPGEKAEINGDLAAAFYFSGSKFYQEYNDADRANEAANKALTDFSNSLEDRLTKGESRETIMKEYNEKAPALQEQATKDMIDFIAKHPNSEGAAAFIPELGDLDAMKKAAAALSDNIKNGRMHDYYQKAIDEAQQQADADAAAAKKQAAGVVAPDFTLNDLNGKPLALSSLKGKYVVLDFWGTWCVWCVRGIPKMKEYYNKYKGKFEILSIDCNDSQEKWKAGVKKYELPWLHVYQPAKGDVQTTDLYAIQGFPTKILIGPDGKIIKTYVGEDPSFYTFLDKTFGK